MSSNTDSAPVRTGEELNVEALRTYLNQALGSDGSSLEIRQFPGGHSNLTYLIRYGPDELVLRRPPIGPVAPTAHDMPREYKLLSAVYPLFPLAPKPILLCEDHSVIGVPFYLMERRRGLIVRSDVSPAIAGIGVRRALSEAVVDTLVKLHAVEIENSGIVHLGKPVGFVGRQVEGWASRWERSKTGDLAQMEEVIQWLRGRIPIDDGEGASIVHNDFKLDNVMLDEQDPTRVVAVLDWEMSTVGDPLIDVGLFLAYWTMKGTETNSSLRAITNGPGWFARQEIIDRYEQSTGRDLSRIVFYETFARFKVAVVIQQIYFRYVRGQTQDERFAHLDVLVKQLAEDALELAQRSAI
ncbi:MAG TPA: phosphotransferase family protein [Pyrinomonadaceae bacterium]